jgi:hypothetical protein
VDPQIGRAGFGIGTFLVTTGGMLLFTLERNSAEFVVTTAIVFIGLVFMLGIALAVIITRRE